jgi:group I intron endonuclease
MKGTIYCVHCIPTGKKYIGQTIQKLQYRINDHFCRSSNSQYKFHRAIRKYGKINFIYGIVEECDFSIINEREMYWVNFYDTFKNGYNSDTGGLNGRLLSEQTKSILRQKNLKEHNARWGVKLDENLKSKIRQSNSKYEYQILEIDSGIIHHTNSLRHFCTLYNLKKCNLMRTYTNQYKQHKGFRVISKISVSPLQMNK